MPKDSFHTEVTHDAACLSIFDAPAEFEIEAETDSEDLSHPDALCRNVVMQTSYEARLVEVGIGVKLMSRDDLAGIIGDDGLREIERAAAEEYEARQTGGWQPISHIAQRLAEIARGQQ